MLNDVSDEWFSCHVENYPRANKIHIDTLHTEHAELPSETRALFYTHAGQNPHNRKTALSVLNENYLLLNNNSFEIKILNAIILNINAMP